MKKGFKMEIQASYQTQNYQNTVQAKESSKTQEQFSKFINKDGTLNISLDERELKELSYEEIKELRKYLQEAGVLKDTDANGNSIGGLGSSLLHITDLTNDESFNKTMFETMKTKDEPGLFFMEMKHNMEYAQGRRAHPWPTISLDEAQGNFSPMSAEEFKTIDVKKFLNEIIKAYEELLFNLPYYLDRKETEETLQGYKDLQESYQKELDEKNSILESYTKNNKENRLLKNE